MKKLLLFGLIAIAVSLAACGAESEGESEPAQSEENVSKDGSETDDEEAGNDTVTERETVENEIGTFSIAKQVKDLDEIATSGPMELAITGIQAGELEPDDVYIDLFDGKEKVTIITVGMKAENTSEDTTSMYPDQAVLTTNTGDQVDADLFLSDSVGGEFFGPVNKEGEVLFQLDTPASEIENIKLIISGAHDENFESVGEDVQIELSF
ncbi:hypothetical protein [Oceanobacillus damuensis]|uniref:hypothetical protein n=1 Tax=Oceanobacillus damuensis TaxID=937928 RepID=UPI00082A9145|nr:hypothetical protein [Oceanobacillus damuensis]